MTDTTTTEPSPDAEIESVAEALPVEAGKAPHDDALQTRFLIPLLLPILAMVAVALYAINVSRAFVAGDSTSALIIATIITLAILVGASLISATPGARTSSLAMVVGLVLVIAISAGLLALGPSVDTGDKGGSSKLAQPSGPPVGIVEIEALASIRYNQSDFAAPAGIVEFQMSGVPGHTMQFRELDYNGFPIGTDGSPAKGKVELKAGKTYNVYCTIGNHAAEGMVAKVIVSDTPPPAS